MIFYGKCFMCKLNRFFVRKREIFLKQVNRTATSKEVICGSCYRGILKAQEMGILN